MSGKNNGGKNLLKEFSFVLAVLVLVAALGGIYLLHRKQEAAEQAKLERIIANEQSPQINNAKVLSEQISLDQDDKEKEAEPKPEEKPAEVVAEAPVDKAEPTKAPEPAGQKEPAAKETTMESVTVAADSGTWQAATPVGSVNATSVEAEVEKTTEAQVVAEVAEVATTEAAETTKDVKEASVLIINGTYKNGVASYWEGKFREAGYTNLLTGSYSGKAEQVTAIYGTDKEMAAAFREFFPTAEIRDGPVPAGYTMADETQQPADNCDFYIVVGIADAAQL